MPPFISYTQVDATTAGQRESLVFINVAHIARATFNKDDGTLMVTVVDGVTTQPPPIKGEEAQAALKVLQKCK